MKQNAVILLLIAVNLYTIVADTYDRSWRYDTIAIPRLLSAPTIDATVGDDEWARATLFPPTLVLDPNKGAGLPMRKRTWIWMGYTADSIYVAFRQELPADHLPLQVTITDKRDACEGPDNTVNVWLAHEPGKDHQFHFSFNAASQIYDRTIDSTWTRWNANVTYKSRQIPTGWEGEVQIPFAELLLKEAPADGTKWRCRMFSFWRKTEEILSAWPYVRWWGAPGEIGTIVFAGNAPAVRFEQPGTIKVVGSDAQVQTKLMVRKGKSRQSYFKTIDSAILASAGEGATFESTEKIIADALAAFEPVTQADKAAEYLMRYDVKAGERVLAAGVAPFYKPAPLELEVNPFFLQAHKLNVEATAESPQAKWLEASLKPVGLNGRTEFKGQRAQVEYATKDWKIGSYELAATAKDDQNNVVATTTVPIVKPEPPDWWTMDYGREPKVPPPWTPVKAGKKQVEVLGRKYDFDSLAVPSKVETRGKQILAAPMEFRTSKPWEKSTLKLVKKDQEAVVYESESIAGDVKLKVRTQVEFDGFMYVDLELTPHPALSPKGRGKDSTSERERANKAVSSPLAGEDKGEGEAVLDKLDFVIPFNKEHASLMQNYHKSAGPGDAQWKNPNETNNLYKAGRRFVGFVPDYTLKTPVMLTTWIGTDHYGFEFSAESSRGWAMAKPNEAMDVSREGYKVLLTLHLISRPVKLSSEPRRIRFGLVATPTKTVMPYLMRSRFYDNVSIAMDFWGQYPAWSPPERDPKRIEKLKQRVAYVHDANAKCVLYGNWHVSTQDPMWDTWGKEMVAEPLSNVSWDTCKQFASCYNSPFARFMVNSYGHNAKLLGFDGIRFDTVVPPYECQSLAHGCGWRDDDGKLYGTYPLFSQREAWKSFYRIFHGGVIKDGIIYTPNAAGPLMAVHSFSDHHEIGEGYYMKALTLKDGYPPDMVRANMTGEAYGFRAENNLKGSPLVVNHRMTALLVHGVEGRMGDYRSWRPGYAANCNPAPSIWDAWDWVDRWNAQFLGYWENGDYMKVNAGTNMVWGSIWWNKDKQKVLLVVGNYEQTPFDDLPVKLSLDKLGLKGEICAEDAITLEPVPVSADGTLKLDVLGERYRLVKISGEKPRYRDEVLSPNVIAGAPAEITATWQSVDLKLDPNSTYVIRADVKIDKMLSQSPSFDNYLQFRLNGEGVHGVLATNTLARTRLDDGKFEPTFVNYWDTPHYRQQQFPTLWEPTPGWYTLFHPIGTGSNTTSGKLEIGFVGKAEGAVRNVSVRKVTGP